MADTIDPVKADGPPTEHFVHFPKLVLSGVGVEVLGGRLERFRFADFKELDSDWAREMYFERTRPTVWRYSPSGSVPDDSAPVDENDEGDSEFEPACEMAALIYDALLVEVPILLPNPRMSIHYLRRPESWQRRVGPYERTFLLNGDHFEPVEDEALSRVAVRAERWYAAGFAPQAKVFGPLRGLSLLASGALTPAFGVAPLIVSLEGYLLGRRVSGGIAKALSRQVRALISLDAREDVEKHVSRLYAWRSEIVHGRPISDPNLPELFGWLCWLTRAVVAFGAERAIAQGSDGNDLSIVRGGNDHE